MIIGHSRPTGVTVSVSGSGAALLTSGDNLFDGRPGTLDRFRWISGAQTTSSVMRVRLDWAVELMPRLVFLSNLSLPAGTLILARWRRSTDTLGTYPWNPAQRNPLQRIAALPRGEKNWCNVLAAQAAVKGLELQFTNDVNGAALIAASTLFDVGEIAICEGDELVIKKGWGIEPNDDTMHEYSISKQPYPEPGTYWREYTFELPLSNQRKVFGDPAALSDTDYEELFAKIDRGRRSVFIPRHVNADGTFSEQMLHRTAMLGLVTRLPKATHKAGAYFDSSTVTVVEAPIPT